MNSNQETISLVRFTYVESQDRYKAELFKDNQIGEWKYLSPIEVEGLQEWLPTEGQTVTVDALGLYEDLDNMWFDTPNGEPTNFEEMLFNLVQDEIDE